MALLSIDKNEDAALEAACDVLSNGGLVALPTETVYGLAADATNGLAVARIFAAKGRPSFNPLICHVSSLAMACQFVRFDAMARKLADAFWPGPLTLVLPALNHCPVHPLTRAGLDTLAIRMPGGFARRLIDRYGGPLAAPSANISGGISPTRAEHVVAGLGDTVDLILDGGAATVGVESTILKPQEDGVALLRPGGLDRRDIEMVTGSPLIRQRPGATIEAPGMLKSHYAPQTPVSINATHVDPGQALITFGRQTLDGETNAVRVFNLSPAADLREAAANLFDFLSMADACGATRIAVSPIPSEGLGEAINDRLARAATPANQMETATDD